MLFLEVVEADILRDTLGDVEGKVLLNVCPFVLLRLRPKHMVIYFEMFRPRH